MAKKREEMLGPDGQIYQLKRPYHKRPFFWIALVQAILLLVTTTFGVLMLFTVLSLEEHKNTLEEQLLQLHSIRERVPLGKNVDFSQGESVTVLSIKEDDQLLLSDDSNHNTVLVELKIVNKGKSDYHFSPYDFGLYDQDFDSYILDSSTLDEKGQDAPLKAGEERTYRLIFDGENQEEQAWSLVYRDSLWTSQEYVNGSRP